MARRKRTDPSDELAQAMVRALVERRGRGESEYPTPLGRLGEAADPCATPQQVLRAARKKAFIAQTVAAKAGTIEAPVALVDDLAALAASPRTIELALRSLRTRTVHARSVAQLGDWLAAKLRPAFKAAVGRQVQDGTLPPGVGCICDRQPKLFLVEDLQPAALRALLSSPYGRGAAGEGGPGPAGPDFAGRFAAAFDSLDRAKGSHNFVSLVDLRQALSDVPREEFDAGLRALRMAGRFSLSAAESLYGVSPEQRQASVEEAGTLLVHVSRKSP